MPGQRLYSDSAAKRERLTSWQWVAPGVHSGQPDAITRRVCSHGGDPGQVGKWPDLPGFNPPGV